MKPFDFERLRHNWDRARVPPTPAPGAGAPPGTPLASTLTWQLSPDEPERAAACLAAVEERVSIDSTWRHVQALVAEQYPTHAASLEAFIAEISRLLDCRNELGSFSDGAQRDEFEAAIADLEDLLEVYGGLGR